MDADRLANVKRNAYNGYAMPADVLDLIRELAKRDTPCVWDVSSGDGWDSTGDGYRTGCGNWYEVIAGEYCQHCGHRIEVTT